MSRPAHERYLLLDHGRGLAALAVVSFHAAHQWIVGPAPAGLTWLAAIAREGWRGVHVFFVISGYCIAQLAWREIRGRRSPLRFLRDRFLRIFPAYWAACLLAAALALLALPFNELPLLATATAPGALPSSVREWLGHSLLIEPLLGQQSYLLVAWTLSWELAYYVMVAILVVVGVQLGVIPALLLALLAALAGACPPCLAQLPALGGWTEFTCGAMVFGAATARQEGRPSWPWLTAMALLGGLGLLVPAASIMLSFSAAFAFLLHWLRPYDHILAHRPGVIWLGALGAMSYSIYLVHAPVISPVINLLRRQIPASSPYFLVPIFVAGAAGLATAGFFYRFVECRVEQWRKTRCPALPPSPLSNS